MARFGSGMGQVLSRGGSRWLLLAVLVVAGFMGLALEGSRSAADDGARAPAVARDKVDDLLENATPVASLSTETSKTYRRPDGTFVTRVFAQSKDGDSNLIQAPGGGFTAEGDDATTTFPATLSDPVRIRRGDDWVAFELMAGRGQGRRTARPSPMAMTVLAAIVVVIATAAGEKSRPRDRAELQRLIQRDERALARQGIFVMETGITGSCVLVRVANPTAPNIQYLQRRYGDPMCIRRQSMPPVRCPGAAHLPEAKGEMRTVPNLLDLGIYEAETPGTGVVR